MKNSWQPFWLRGPGVWAVDFRVEGHRIRRRLPVKDQKLKSLAIEIASDMYRDAWEKELSQPPENERTTFASAAEFYHTRVTVNGLVCGLFYSA